MDKLAEIFDDMARLYMALDEKYRSAAYSSAAIRIRQWIKDGQPLPQPRLAGARITEKINEYNVTGRITEYEMLKERASAAAVFSGILGVGPTQARNFVDKYGTLTELRKAVARGDTRLSDVQRLGLRYYSDLNTRQSRPVAAAIARDVINKMRQRIPEAQIEIAGSYRRGLDTVGDLDIICGISSKHRSVKKICEPARGKVVKGKVVKDKAVKDKEDDKAVIAVTKDLSEHLATAQNYVALINSGKSRITLLWAGPMGQVMQVDILIVPLAEYAAALLYFTGSKDFNVAMRGIAKSAGMRLNQMGLFKNGVLIPTPAESDIFAKLGLPYIDPANRVLEMEADEEATAGSSNDA